MGLLNISLKVTGILPLRSLGYRVLNGTTTAMDTRFVCLVTEFHENNMGFVNFMGQGDGRRDSNCPSVICDLNVLSDTVTA